MELVKHFLKHKFILSFRIFCTFLCLLFPYTFPSQTVEKKPFFSAAFLTFPSFFDTHDVATHL